MLKEGGMDGDSGIGRSHNGLVVGLHCECRYEQHTLHSVFVLSLILLRLEVRAMAHGKGGVRQPLLQNTVCIYMQHSQHERERERVSVL